MEVVTLDDPRIPAPWQKNPSIASRLRSGEFELRIENGGRAAALRRKSPIHAAWFSPAQGWTNTVLTTGEAAMPIGPFDGDRPAEPLGGIDPPGFVCLPPRRDDLADRLHALCGQSGFLRATIGRYNSESKPLIAGYAALWDSPSTDVIRGQREVIRQGAFAGALAAQPFVKALAGHHGDLLVASTSHGTLWLGEDDTGLLAIVDPHGTETGRDLLACIRAGEITQMSPDLRPASGGERNIRHGGESFREISKVSSLPEVSFVRRGAFSQTACVVLGERRQSGQVSRSTLARRERLLAMEART